ncbi:MAG: 30S ribosomal protein S16 [Candidatus Omnitrophica bacterium]|nr:30S ribosomal protein S16 [Candidatus Omnitrophota bacterium]
MEVRIRLQKAGKSASKRYNYRIVAMSRNQGRQGRHLAHIGYYDPAKKPASLSIDQEQLDKWVEKGAQMSDTVRSLVKNNLKNK